MRSMVLIPAPQKLQWKEGTFALPAAPGVALPEAFGGLCALMPEHWRADAEGCLRFARAEDFSTEGYALSVTPQGVRITAAAPQGAFYALATLGQLILQTDGKIPCCEIEDAPALAVRGFMLDISRGKVPTLQNLCGRADRLALLKYKKQQRYIEGF